jgi:hypothetical protein
VNAFSCIHLTSAHSRSSHLRRPPLHLRPFRRRSRFNPYVSLVQFSLSFSPVHSFFQGMKRKWDAPEVSHSHTDNIHCRLAHLRSLDRCQEAASQWPSM